jgi:polar amino acid transport system permease protein
MATASSAATDHGDIKAVPLRRPGRAVTAIILVVLLALFVYGAATNDAYDWNTYGKYIFDKRISDAAVVTLELTLISMAIAIVLGVILAVMRMSDNPVLKSVAWLYLWIFRGTPVYIQLVFWGLITNIYSQLDLGVPFLVQFTHLKTESWLTPFVAAFIGLGLNEAAYMAEIVRAGIGSVDEGQQEAAVALAMTWGMTMRRVVLPQAMRVIIPPTGNEVISMLKTTSLVVAVPLTTDLYSVGRQIGGVLFRPIPLLLVISTWYLAVTSILMVGQYFLEKRYSRGASRVLTPRQLRALAAAQSAERPHGGM